MLLYVCKMYYKLSRVKILHSFWTISKSFPHKFFLGGGGGIGHVRRGILRGKNSQKVSPLKVFYYTVSACFVTVVHFSCEYMYVLKCV